MADIETMMGMEPELAPSHSQVYKVTHNGQGDPLPYMQRSFISFSYGGKNIEDFNLISVIENNSMDKPLYSSFDDVVTEGEIWDGQLYWKTHYNVNEITFTLFTDGITEKQLNDFKHWFQPGMIRELILSEAPNRAILARISEPPVYHMLPFEKKIEVQLSSNLIIPTSTTEYKGSIELHLITDDPFWYSRANVLYLTEQMTFVDDLNNPQISYDYSEGAKIIYEDSIPLASELNVQVGIGGSNSLILNDSYAQYGSRVYDLNEDRIRTAIDYYIAQNLVQEVTVNPNDTYQGAIVYDDDEYDYTTGTIFPTYYEMLGGYTINPDSEESDNLSCFFYSGTAPCYPLIQFTIQPEDDENGYIIVPGNSYASNKYNTISIESVTKQTMKFTTPSLYTSYNQVIEILNRAIIGQIEDLTWESLCEALRLGVKHYKARELVLAAVNATRTFSVSIAPNISNLNNIINTFKSYFCANNTFYPVTCLINCQTGQVLIQTFIYNGTTEETFVENAGDMIRSDYFKIVDRNYFDETGRIAEWSEEHPEYSHKITADVQLTNVIFRYKYLYL